MHVLPGVRYFLWTVSFSVLILPLVNTDHSLSYGDRISANVGPLHQPTKVCYDNLGCFGNEYPFYSEKRPVISLPQSPQLVGTQFLLYTRNTSNLTWGEQLVPGELCTLQNSHFRSNQEIKFIVHGFIQDSTFPWISFMVKELLKHEDYNVIVVNWKNGARWPYMQAVANTRLVGAQIAQFIRYLIRQSQAQMWQFHIIGHSLGAHIAGYAGHRLKNLPRISGLDPARLLFEIPHREVRLDTTDAEFVDIMHTDGGPFGFGLIEAIGHADFYPNRGVKQPGCMENMEAIYRTLSEESPQISLTESNIRQLSCSHQRAVDYFTESINTKCPLIGFTCDTWWHFRIGACWECKLNETCSRMGFHATKSQPRKSFYLSTAAQNPYCVYYYKMYFKVSKDQTKPTRGHISVLLNSGNNSNFRQKEITYIQPFKTGPQTLSARQTISYLFQNQHNMPEVTSAVVRYIRDVSLFESWTYDRNLQVDTIAIETMDEHANKNLTVLCGGTVRSGHVKTLSGTNCV